MDGNRAAPYSEVEFTLGDEERQAAARVLSIAKEDSRATMTALRAMPSFASRLQAQNECEGVELVENDVLVVHVRCASLHPSPTRARIKRHLHPEPLDALSPALLEALDKMFAEQISQLHQKLQKEAEEKQKEIDDKQKETDAKFRVVRKETDEKQKETDEKFRAVQKETDEKWRAVEKEIDEKQKETDEKFRAVQKETDEKWRAVEKEIDEKQKETDEKFRALQKETDETDEKWRAVEKELDALEARLVRMEIGRLVDRAETAVTLRDPFYSSYPLPLAQAIAKVFGGPGGGDGLDPYTVYEHAQASNHPRFRPDPRQSAFEIVIAALETQVEALETGSEPQAGALYVPDADLTQTRALLAEAKCQSGFHQTWLAKRVNALLSAASDTAAESSTRSVATPTQQPLSPPPCKSSLPAASESTLPQASSPAPLLSDTPALLSDPPALDITSIPPTASPCTASPVAASSASVVSEAKPTATPVPVPAPVSSVAMVRPSDAAASIPLPPSPTSSTASSSAARTSTDTDKASKKTEANRKKKARQKKNKMIAKDKEEMEKLFYGSDEDGDGGAEVSGDASGAGQCAPQ
ncbi:hypothetical protein JCM10213_003832 [Rhodosporidiobolus nylandii]